MKQVKDLVFANNRYTESYTDTLIIAKMMEVEHKTILRTVRRLIKNGHISQHNCVPRDYFKRGQTYPKYDLTQSGTRRLIMSLRGGRAEDVKTMLNNAFDDMAQFLSTNQEWTEAREHIKVPTKTLHDAIDGVKIKLDQDYPDSSRGRRFFTHIHDAINKIIIGIDRKGRTRDNFTLEEIERTESKERDMVRVIDALEEMDAPSELIRWYTLAILNAEVGRVKTLSL